MSRSSVVAVVAGALCTAVLLVHAFSYFSSDTLAEDDMPATPAQSIPTQMPRGTVKNGLAAFLLSPAGNGSVSTDQPIPLIFGVIFVGRSIQEDRMKIWPVVAPVDPLNLSWFSVSGPDGQELRYGGYQVDFGNPPFPPDRAISLTRDSFYGKVADLNENYDLSQPGTYTVKWHYSAYGRGAWEGELTSNELLVEIK